MHVDAFFDYLMGRPGPYWTSVPSDPNPVSELGRDGVAAEDDMALRALLPQIRPRRGRRKAEDDDHSKSPSQQPVGEEEYDASRLDGVGPWSAHPDGRGSVFVFPVSESLRLSAGTGQPSGPPWTTSDVIQTPLTAYPQSAITPSTGNLFWVDEPKSAISPSKPRLSKRHGAKVVSSAWRTGLAGKGKARGRPPMNRTNNDGPFSAFPSTDAPSFKIPPRAEENGSRSAVLPPPAPFAVPATPAAAPAPAPAPAPPTVSTNEPAPNQDTQNTRPAKRSRLSLQVPARVGGEVRLATPPPLLMVNGQAPMAADDGGQETTRIPLNISPKGIVNDMSGGGRGGGPSPFSAGTSGPAAPQLQARFGDPTDRTNMDELEAYFAHEVLSANWYDAKGNRIPPCGVDEASAIIATVIDNLLKAAVTKDAFLINLAALAGAKLLMSTTNVAITRLGELPDRNKYSCTWELRLGDLRGIYSMEETVMHDRWKVPEKGGDSVTTPASGGDATAEQWQQKYKEMCDVVKKRDKELADLRHRVVESLKDPRPGN